MLSTGDVEVLYRTRGRYLQRLVRLDSRAPDDVIEDACQHAWSCVLAHRARVDGGGAFAWLARTAMREAWRLNVCRDEQLECVEARAASADTATDVVEHRDRLAQLRRLPARQQRLLWLHAAGFSYAEIARHEGVTVRTVERQMLRGKARVRAIDAGQA